MVCAVLMVSDGPCLAAEARLLASQPDRGGFEAKRFPVRAVLRRMPEKRKESHSDQAGE
ncbi:unnamed protein product [Protopolystoma xenopodis]|uniref:Uncharacterized protein n=1 Tax=Protopolystoma xenopodis TaxID=117903 RepID=A0A3S5BZB5_9PLAT|nr:unnamed protein product [Protopolystoma xenopodis]